MRASTRVSISPPSPFHTTNHKHLISIWPLTGLEQDISETYQENKYIFSTNNSKVWKSELKKQHAVSLCAMAHMHFLCDLNDNRNNTGSVYHLQMCQSCDCPNSTLLLNERAITFLH